ncbi:hypothetical protein PLESTM_001780300 [Pleodorina starrii]|nr:hypothetical protein PLESTM_001780300 [Pleodorina starrii]
MSTFDDLPPFDSGGLYAHQPGHNPFAAASAEPFPPAEISRVYGTLASRHSLIGPPIADVLDKMFLVPDGAGGASVADPVAAAAAAASSSVARSEFCIAWPPTFPVGGPAEVVELRAAVSLDAAAAAAIGGDAAGGAWAVGAGRDAALAAAAAGCCSRLLAVREDLVVGDERVKGVPTLESFEDAAPLMGLPQAARDEAHRLLWRMMHEALPPNHSVLPYDPDAFRSPIDRMAPRLQAALSWAWSHHFRAFAQDFGYLLDCPPPGAACDTSPYAGGPGAAAAFGSPYGTSADDISGVAATATAAAEESAHYQSVLAQMVVFLRDNDMFACLATLLQTAVARGLALVGHDGTWLAATPAANLHSPLQPSSSMPPMLPSPPPRGGAAAATVSSTAVANGGDADASPLAPGDVDDWAVSSACSSPRSEAYIFAAAAATAYDNANDMYDTDDAHDTCDGGVMAAAASAGADGGCLVAADDDDADAEGDAKVESQDAVADSAAVKMSYDEVAAVAPTVMAAPSIAWAAAAAAAVLVMMPLALALMLVLGLETLAAAPPTAAAAAAAAFPRVGVRTGADGGSSWLSWLLILITDAGSTYVVDFVALMAVVVLAFAAATVAAAMCRRRCDSGPHGVGGVGGVGGGVTPRGYDVGSVFVRGAGAVLLALVTWWAAAAASAAAATATAPTAGLAAAAAVAAVAAAAAMVTSRTNRRRDW